MIKYNENLERYQKHSEIIIDSFLKLLDDEGFYRKSRIST